MKLDDQISWYARAYVDIKIKKDLTELFEIDGNFPIDIGAVILKSKDGKRDYVLDSYYTECCNDKKNVGEVFNFFSKLEVDKDTFPEGEYNYELTVEDLADCTGEFFCNVAEDYMETPEIELVLWMNGGTEYTHVIKIEQE